jgi:hypothetical protein
VKQPPDRIVVLFCPECGFYDCYSEPSICVVCAARAEVRLVRVRYALMKRRPT